MDFLMLKDISERYMELVNPTSSHKVLTMGRVASLRAGRRVIDFGCGYGEALALWAEHFGISGVGIDVREQACRRAREKMADRALGDRIEIICGDAARYKFEPGAFYLAACIGATFIWGGFRPAIRAMKAAIHPGGKLLVGEAYWQRSRVPPEYARAELSVHAEHELLEMAREEGFDLEYVVHASHDEWDRYESDNWRGLIHWLEANPNHPQRGAVVNHFHDSQNEYLRWGREYLGWAMYLLNPVCSRAQGVIG